MSLELLKRLFKQKEGILLEFKEAKTALPKNLFESICSMLNRDGGDIILGANDDGVVTGVDESRVSDLVTDLVNLSNNKNKLDPPFILFPQSYKIDGLWLIHIQVPSSSQVHKTGQVIYDRSNDGDFRITEAHQIAEIHNRKRNHYTENLIYPALRFEDFKADLFPKIRNLINSNNPNHPWLYLDNRELLEKAGLWKTDYYSGQEGYTLAAALLLGKDEVIQNIVPHYKIDALVRIDNLDRYDDREYIQTNLIEAYEQLMAFVAKHLPDKFYLEGDQRVSLRTQIFREVVANLIVHREYTNAHPSTFIIYADRVETENANNPHGNGPIDPNKFTPYPKNPTIAKFFIQLGRVEELGSGVLNVVRLIREYADTGTAQFIEGATFKMIIPVDADGKNEITVHDIVNDAASDLVSKLIDDGVNDGVIDGVNDGVKSELIRLVKTVKAESGIKANAIAHHLGKSTPTIERYLKIVRNLGLIEFKGSYKSGGYEVTEKLLTALSKKGL